ncbi:MAG: alpha/beta hydrolase family protein, partial [Actinomycetota bacterium]
RGAAPVSPAVPAGPTIQESSGVKAPVRTFQDLLRNAHDEALFDYYFTSQLALVDSTTGRSRMVGQPGVFAAAEPSPDGRRLLVVRLQRPYSYLVGAWAFPRVIEVWDKSGKREHRIAELPLADRVPIGGVAVGPRSVEWIPTEPAALVWAEALDEGDPKKKVAHRDALRLLKAPFTAQAVELARTQHRYSGLSWVGTGGEALLSEFDRDRRWRRTFLISVQQPGAAGRLIWDRSVQDLYSDPGVPLLRTLPNGQRVAFRDGDSIFLAGTGASPQGDRPFLDRFNLATLKAERLFQSALGSYESVVTLTVPDGTRFITRRETAVQPPNYLIRGAGEPKQVRLTEFPDPTPQIRQIKKQLVTYQRADGVPLSFTLYLPPNHKPGERLPTVVWAYPREFNDASTAGQVSGSPDRFTTLGGASHLFFLLQGYAVLDNATMPVVGDPETVNNTFLEQIVASAKAAIDKATEMGVTDPKRVGVGGHSYGAFMTANLLAHSDLFRAGIARSGAYNRTLTPFGFQSERRTLWEAPDVYLKVSPFLHADKINEPVLIVHGEADDNPGTFPIQSERLFHAIQGTGGAARYVTLPHESHGYAARESVGHVLHEMITWFDRHVKSPSSGGG